MPRRLATRRSLQSAVDLSRPLLSAEKLYVPSPRRRGIGSATGRHDIRYANLDRSVVHIVRVFHISVRQFRSLSVDYRFGYTRTCSLDTRFRI